MDVRDTKVFELSKGGLFHFQQRYFIQISIFKQEVQTDKGQFFVFKNAVTCSVTASVQLYLTMAWLK